MLDAFTHEGRAARSAPLRSHRNTDEVFL